MSAALAAAEVPAIKPLWPPMPPRRSQRGYAGLKRSCGVAPASPPAGEPPAPPQPKKGKRPTHELVRVIHVDGRKAYQPVAVLWLRENGKGFVKLNADLTAGDDLMIAPIRTGGAS